LSPPLTCEVMDGPRSVMRLLGTRGSAGSVAKGAQWPDPRELPDGRLPRPGPRPARESPRPRRRGRHLEAFYGSLYYAALRPSEAVALGKTDCYLPSRGWGRIDLAASEPRAGRDWTDHGTARQARGLKHRAAGEMRSIPIPPALVTLLRTHLKTYGTAPGGRLFRTARGGPARQRLQRRLASRPHRGVHPRSASLPAGPPPPRPVPRRRLAVAQRRGTRH